jgi:hypothetical protein
VSEEPNIVHLEIQLEFVEQARPEVADTIFKNCLYHQVLLRYF